MSNNLLEYLLIFVNISQYKYNYSLLFHVISVVLVSVEININQD